MKTHATIGVALLLLALATPVPSQEEEALNALCTAVKSGDIEAVKKAVADGAKAGEPCGAESTVWPLHLAVGRGDVEVVRYLLQQGADVNHPEGSAFLTPLHLAALLHDDPAVAGVLVEAGADLDAVDDEGGTPLDLALAEGRQAVAEFLAAKGAKRGEEPGMVPPSPAPGPDDAASQPAPAQPAAGPGKRTEDGKLIFKGLCLGMPILDAIEVFRRLDMPPYLYEGDPRHPVPEDPSNPRPDARGIVHHPDGTLRSSGGRYAYAYNDWILEAHPDGRVKKFMLSGRLVNQLFQAGNTVDSEFIGGFLAAYGLTEGVRLIEMKVRSPVRWREDFDPETCEALEYTDPSGWYLTINQYRDIVYGETAGKPTVKFD